LIEAHELGHNLGMVGPGALLFSRLPFPTRANAPVPMPAFCLGAPWRHDSNTTARKPRGALKNAQTLGEWGREPRDIATWRRVEAGAAVLGGRSDSHRSKYTRPPTRTPSRARPFVSLRPATSWPPRPVRRATTLRPSPRRSARAVVTSWPRELLAVLIWGASTRGNARARAPIDHWRARSYDALPVTCQMVRRIRRTRPPIELADGLPYQRSTQTYMHVSTPHIRTHTPRTHAHNSNSNNINT
jgi:hypothetical protein